MVEYTRDILGQKNTALKCTKKGEKPMLNMTVRNTAKLIRAKSKSENVRLGRFFTKKETARLMANMLTLDDNKTAYTVLDPGAGTGILASAVIEEICQRCKNCRQIFITCYENNPEFIPMLQDNLERVRKKARHDYDVRVYVTIYEENYITESQNHYTVTFLDVIEDKFDVIICNPPTDFVEKGTTEANRAGGVTQVKISAAYLFAKMELVGWIVSLDRDCLAVDESIQFQRRPKIGDLIQHLLHLRIS